MEEEEDSSLELDLLSSLLLSSLELDLLSSLVFSSLSLPSEVVMEIGKEELSSSLEEGEELLETGLLAPQLANNIVRENNENPCKNRLFSIELDSLMVILQLILSPLGKEGKRGRRGDRLFLFPKEERRKGLGYTI